MYTLVLHKRIKEGVQEYTIYEEQHIVKGPAIEERQTSKFCVALEGKTRISMTKHRETDVSVILGQYILLGDKVRVMRGIT